MTVMFGINENNDIFIAENGNLSVKNAQPAVEDACQTASQMRLGEAVLQTGLGLPMFQSLFNGVPTPAIYENALRNTLQSVEGVEKVTVIELSANNNIFSYVATIESQYGITFTMNG